MGRIGAGELLLILFIALLIFGPGKLADMGKGLGEGLKNFKKGLSTEDEAKKQAEAEEAKKVAETAAAARAAAPSAAEAHGPDKGNSPPPVAGA
jgi:sec-independent protein translocase protein TatA